MSGINPNIGKFVRSVDNKLGVGKVVESNARVAIVEYFDSPVSPSWPRFELPISSLREQRVLEEQTRVYFFDETAGYWRMGRVHGHVDSDVFVSLPNKEQARVHSRHIYVRWKKPLGDPWRHVEAMLSETPFFHQYRSGLVRHMIRQRAASSGLTGLISAPVELHTHQIEVVNRVLTDPVQRYLLADEVGLGKTIEAGIILRQHILDNPTQHGALIVAPESLVDQWEEQLRDRCQIGRLFGHQITIISLEILEGWKEFQPDFIIVDEAHQVTRQRSGAYSTLRRLSDPSRCRNLLLLSATPVLRNEAGFLALLHLLDPKVYDLSDVKGFRHRIARRQNLADLFAGFTEDQLPYFLNSSADELATVFPDDLRLGSMIAKLKPLLESEEDEQGIRSFVRRIRVHLSETYRLNRRILRNRREALLPELMTGRSKLVTIPWKSSYWPHIHDALETWRNGASASVWGSEESQISESLARIFILFWEAAESDLEALIYCATLRLLRDDSKKAPDFGPLAGGQAIEQLLSIPLFENEDRFLRKLIALKDICGNHRNEQIEMVSRLIGVAFDKDRRVLCITTSPNSADAIFAALVKSNTGLVFRHKTDSSSWRQEWHAPGRKVLVCDWRAEEGLNLQGGDCLLIHLDLPFSPNRIEQRMGRLDRFGRGKKVRSVVLKPEEAGTHNAWVQCLNEAWQVFSRSISALQYVVEEEMEKLTRDFFVGGEDAIHSSRERLSKPEGLEREFKLIRNQDALDSIQSSAANGTDLLKERIEDYEEAEEELAGALQGWMSECLHFIKVGEKDPLDKVIRFHYAKTDRGANTLLSVSDLENWFGPSLDRNAIHKDFRPPLTRPVSCWRQTAIHRNCGLARLGNPVVDSILSHITWDDRGTSFAMSRRVIDLALPAPRLFFRLDFIIEADVTDANHDPAVRRLADAAFPPFIETLWIDQDLQTADEDCLHELARPYNQNYDTNIRPDILPKAIAKVGCGRWADLCDSVRSVGERLLFKKFDLQSLVEAKAKDFTAARSIVQEQFSSRLAALPKELASERGALKQEIKSAKDLTDILEAGILHPLIHLDSAGIVILSSKSGNSAK
jgi:ATP-dependent helicase HepA